MLYSLYICYTFQNACTNLHGNSGEPQACYKTGKLSQNQRHYLCLTLFGPLHLASLEDVLFTL